MWVLSKHVCLVLCPPCPKSGFSLFSPPFTANNQPDSSSVISHVENTATSSRKLHFTSSSNCQEAPSDLQDPMPKRENNYSFLRKPRASRKTFSGEPSWLHLSFQLKSTTFQKHNPPMLRFLHHHIFSGATAESIRQNLLFRLCEETTRSRSANSLLRHASAALTFVISCIPISSSV